MGLEVSPGTSDGGSSEASDTTSGAVTAFPEESVPSVDTGIEELAGSPEKGDSEETDAVSGADAARRESVLCVSRTVLRVCAETGNDPPLAADGLESTADPSVESGRDRSRSELLKLTEESRRERVGAMESEAARYESVVCRVSPDVSRDLYRGKLSSSLPFES